MQEMTVFENNDFGEIRTVCREGEPLFVAADVCSALDIDRTQTRRLDDDEKGMCLMHTPGGEQEMTVVTESGLYSLVLGSRKPEAKAFKRWITHEVIPSIRKTGSYTARAMTPAQLLAAQAQVLVEMEKRQQELEARTEEVAQRLDRAMNAFKRPDRDTWKADMDAAISRYCEEHRLSETATRGKMYAELEREARVNVTVRLTRLRERMKSSGMTYKRRMALTKLDAIAADSMLRPAFELVVRRWQAESAE